MYRVEGRPDTIAATRAAVDGLYALVDERREAAVWVWRPHRQVAFGPRDVRHDGFEAAAAAARNRDFAVVERSVGGHPVAHTGETLAFARVVPLASPRRGLTARYDATADRLIDALSTLGISPRRGEPADSFCPGEHSLSADGKLVGLAQRVTASVAAVSGVVIVDGADAVASVLTAVYEPLGLGFDPDTVGSIGDAGGPTAVSTVSRALADALTAGHATERLSVDALLDGSS